MAKVEVTGVDSELESTCFTVSDVGDTTAFKKASISLNNKKNQHQLTISTYETITEPIVNLRVSYHCEPNINREYVLLMDPTPLESSEKKVILEKKVQVTENEVSSYTNSMSDKETASPRKKRNKKKIKATSTDEKLTAAYTGKQSSNLINSSKPNINRLATPQPINTHTDKPYLVVSGGSPDAHTSATQPSLSLRLETQIDLSRTETPTLPVATSEDADEITVMANRLAYLEKQILTLQTRNALLQAEAEKAKNVRFKITNDQLKWLTYILIGITVLIVVALLRRKLIRKRLEKEEATWFNPNEEEYIEETIISSGHDDFKNDVKSFGESEYNPVSAEERDSQNQQNNNYTEDDNDDSDSVLDHADVFIEHGRPGLAIQLLQNHLIDLPSESPAIWIKLLSLLADEGLEAEYITAANECTKYFNIKLPTFTESNTKDSSSIEDYPHIISRLEGVWGSQFAVAFLNDLIYNQDSQTREGFERGTFEELFFLKQIADILHPNNSHAPTKTTSSSLGEDKNMMDRFIPKVENTENTANIAMTTEAFFNASETQFDEIIDIDETEIKNNSHSYGIDRSQKETEDISKTHSNLELTAFTTDVNQQNTNITDINAGRQATSNSFVAEEIDFPMIEDSLSADEFNFEVMPEIETEQFVDENKTSSQEDDKKAEQESNVIEFDWDLPKTKL